MDALLAAVRNFFYSILMTIDAIVYYLVDVCYQVFLTLSRVQLFDESLFGDILKRVYILVGVLMMFFIVYSLLKVIVNPEELSKGDMAPRKIITNVITSLLMVVFLPTAFNLLYQVQGVILDNDLIGRIIVGPNAVSSDDDTIKNGGRTIATNVFKAFLYPNDDYEPSEDETDSSVSDNSTTSSTSEITDEDGHTLDEAFEAIRKEELTFFHIAKFSEPAAEGKLTYLWIISTIAGAVCVWALVCYVFDLGARAIKLFVLQILAPLPIVMRILPKKNDTFKKWVSLVASTFFEVFTRVFFIYLIAILAAAIPDIVSKIVSETTGATFPIQAMAVTFLMLGIIMFARQAPKMIEDIFGIKSGNLGLSLKKRMQESGGFIGGAAVGGATRGAITRGYNAYREGRERVGNAEGFGRKIGAGLYSGIRGIGSIAGGAISSGIRSGYDARNAKTFGDMVQAANQGYTETATRRDEREAYARAHQAGGDRVSEAIQNSGIGPESVRNAIAGMAAVGVGHLSDAKDAAARFVTGESSQTVQKQRDIVNDINNKGKAAKDEITADMEKGTNLAGYVYKKDIFDEDGNFKGSEYRTLQYYKDQVTNAEEAQKNFNESFKKSLAGVNLQTKIDDAEKELLNFREGKLQADKFDINTEAMNLMNSNPNLTREQALAQATIMKEQLNTKYSQENMTKLQQNLEEAKNNYAEAKNVEFEKVNTEARKANKDYDDAKKAVTDSQLKFHMTGKKEYAVKFKDTDLEYMNDGSGRISNINELLKKDQFSGTLGKVKEALDDREDLLKSNSSVIHSYLDKYIAEASKKFAKASPGERVSLKKTLEVLYSAKAYLDENRDSGLFDRLKGKESDNDGNVLDTLKEMLTKDVDGGFEELLNSITATLRDIKKKEDSNKDKKK